MIPRSLLAVAGALTISLLPLSPSRAADAGRAYATLEEAAADPDFALQGEYSGENVGVHVVAQGEGSFLVVLYRGGLPGAETAGTGGAAAGKDKQASEEDAQGVRDLIAELSLKKVNRNSPTLGARPPEGAVVLFDGTPESLARHWQPGAKATDDGLLVQGCTSTDTFTDFTLHVEFRTPYMPQARGQARGNSGVYCQGRYETQVLDSFGLDGRNNETGGIYEVRDPDLNMCFPPLAWQTYDIDFVAARWDTEGKKSASARMTVRLNGVIVQQDVEVPNITRAAPVPETPEPGPIYLQDHGNPVRYRNIWALPRDARAEARRPIVPGFERFYGPTTAGRPEQGGRLLLGELQCTRCHAANEALAAHLLPRQAPILDAVGRRVRPEWLLAYLADPHTVKPGTTMPDLLATRSAPERAAEVTALVNFLVSFGQAAEGAAEPQAAVRGRKLFHEVGCVACHGPRNGVRVDADTTVPLPDLGAKYTLPGLTGFLKNPQHVRPSGRMPSLNLNDNESRDIAAYLLDGAATRPKNPNVRYAAFHGDWQTVPDFGKLEPVMVGDCAGLDLAVAGRENNFGVRFDGFLKIDREGIYTFHLGSDDGSLLFIDGEKVVDVDGIHPHTTHSAKTELAAGVHAVRVDYTQGGGEWTLTLDGEGPGLPRQDVARLLTLTPDGPPASPETPAAGEEPGFVFDPALVEKGRQIFASAGCASCHSVKWNDQTIEPASRAKPLAELDPSRGCLAGVAAETEAASTPREGVPQFDLTTTQRAALSAALAAPIPAEPPPCARQIEQAMTAFNCYACHPRDGKGGPEADRNPLFLSRIHEMGDEGRLPPPLDGVGDKLTDSALNHILGEGAKDRPYMLTRMPKFGGLEHLTQAFAAADRLTQAPFPVLTEPVHRVKSTGRELVGDQALGCIKCHTFGDHPSTGIQAISLTTMTRRLRGDWFHRYLIDPPRFRPGTRMPTGFPNGVATVQSIYNGDPASQVGAIWEFLSDGDKAGLPDGLVQGIIELVPESEPIVYRNFLEGLSPRGIAVGYPEKCHLAWDADRLALALVWHGRFLDASRHWGGRGAGNQGPLGDHVMPLEETVSVAALPGADAPWPTEAPRDLGYEFRGYALNAARQPAFRYDGPRFSVVDFLQPVSRGSEGTFVRKLTVTPHKDAGPLYFRAAAGKIVADKEGWYLLNDGVRIAVVGGGEPVLRESAGRQELLVPVSAGSGPVEIEQQIVW